MALLGGIIVVFGFVILAKLFGLVEKNIKVIGVAKSAALVVRDLSLDDYQKEIAMQKYAKELLALFFLIAIASVLAIGIPFGVIWLMEYANILSVNEVVATMLSVKFILATVVISIVFFFVSN